MKICNYIIYILIIIFLLQTINLHAFQESVQNTEKSSETLDNEDIFKVCKSMIDKLYYKKT